MKKWGGVFVMAIALAFILSNLKTDHKDIQKPLKEDLVPKYEYGILVDTFNVKKGVIKQGQTLGEVLYKNHINHIQIAEAVKKSKAIFDFRYINPGNQYTVICRNDSTNKACYFIYQQDPINYIVMDFREDIDVYKGKKKVETKVNVASGKIKSSLWLTMEENKLSPKIAAELATIYAWTIDFFKVQKDDAFKVYYENRYIDNNYIGIGKILAAEP